MVNNAVVITGIVAGAFVCLAGAAPAGAEDSAAADARFHAGKDLLRSGRIGAACEAFAESQALEPNIATLLSLADCRERNGELAAALELFTAAIEQATDVADEPSFLRVATRRAATLRRRVPRLAFDVPAGGAAPGFTVRLDGAPIPQNRLAFVDPGVHTVSATAEGRAPWSVSIFAPRRARTIVIVVPPLAPPELDPPGPVARVTAPMARVTAPPARTAPSALPPKTPAYRRSRHAIPRQRTMFDVYVRDPKAPPPRWVWGDSVSF